jgi:broad specificity phosphatase PhoE
MFNMPMRRIAGFLAVSAPTHAFLTGYSHADARRYPALRCDSKTNTKIVHFVRHAEGYHNVAGRVDPLFGYLREDLEDAVLTEVGIAQCKALYADSENRMQNAQLLVVSPMNRTMQTATIGFAHLKGKIPWIAIEDLRERTGLHPCDRRRSISDHRASFGHVDFSFVADDADPLFWKYKLREPNAHVIQRARRFVEWLKERPEKEVIVVSHHGYLLDLMGEVLQTTHPDSDAIDFKNCEMRTFIVRF